MDGKRVNAKERDGKEVGASIYERHQRRARLALIVCSNQPMKRVHQADPGPRIQRQNYDIFGVHKFFYSFFFRTRNTDIRIGKKK